MIQPEYRENFIKGLKSNLIKYHTKEDLHEILCNLIDNSNDEIIEKIGDCSDRIYYQHEYENLL